MPLRKKTFQNSDQDPAWQVLGFESNGSRASVNFRRRSNAPRAARKLPKSPENGAKAASRNHANEYAETREAIEAHNATVQEIIDLRQMKGRAEAGEETKLSFGEIIERLDVVTHNAETYGKLARQQLARIQQLDQEAFKAAQRAEAEQASQAVAEAKQAILNAGEVFSDRLEVYADAVAYLRATNAASSVPGAFPAIREIPPEQPENASSGSWFRQTFAG